MHRLSSTTQSRPEELRVSQDGYGPPGDPFPALGEARGAALLVDATELAWDHFAGWLGRLHDDPAMHGRFAFVRPPQGCAREAARLLRDLSLCDRVELLRPDEPDRLHRDPLRTARVAGPGPTPALARLRAGWQRLRLS